MYDGKDANKNKFRDLMRESIALNKKIACDPNQPMKERNLAEKKLKSYLVLLGELYL